MATSATVFADPIKQYILTPAPYSIFVNGVEYKDEAYPILNYEGSTYVPLAKLGDLTGVNYKWNDAAQRVEIVTNGAGKVLTGEGSTLVIDNGRVRDAAAVNAERESLEKSAEKMKAREVIPKGLVNENGEFVFYAYDKDGNYRGRYTDDDITELVIGKIEGYAVLPPKLSEGWISPELLAKIYQAGSKRQTMFG